MKLSRIVYKEQLVGYAFYCASCQEAHTYYIVKWREGGNPVWNFNGNEVAPTFTPSLLYQQPPEKRCHIFITDGIIKYLPDCGHQLAGKDVPIPDWPY